MFRCDKCSNPIGPNVSPTFVVVETRPMTYSEKIGKEVVVVGQGFETVREVKLCHACAGVEEKKGLNPVDVAAKRNALIAVGKAIQEHAKKCKRPLDECNHCTKNIATMAAMPIDVLNVLCSEPSTIRYHVGNKVVTSV